MIPINADHVGGAGVHSGAGVWGEGWSLSAFTGLRRVVEAPHGCAIGVLLWALVRRRSRIASAEAGIADDMVPLLGGYLAGEQGAAPPAAVVEDLDQVVAPLSGRTGQPPT